MRAKMLVDARRAEIDTNYREGQELEGAEAEYQVALGHAEEIVGPRTSDEIEAAAEVQATQAALDHAQAMGIDISTIQGSGKDGKVTKADVEAAVAAKEAS